MKRNKSRGALRARRWHTLSSSILPVPRYSTTADVTTVKLGSERLTRQISRKKASSSIICVTFLFLEVTSVPVLRTREWVGTSGNVTHSLDGLRGRMAVPLKTTKRRVSLDKIDATCGLTASGASYEFSINFTLLVIEIARGHQILYGVLYVNLAYRAATLIFNIFCVKAFRQLYIRLLAILLSLLKSKPHSTVWDVHRYKIPLTFR